MLLLVLIENLFFYIIFDHLRSRGDKKSHPYKGAEPRSLTRIEGKNKFRVERKIKT